ncbi:MAG TPA: GspH/FimT family pseudopilin [Casimicrobiaceae bacterium]|nr:GspH/FimT family pseudopilin [Casimicrobiaceae bacterium]
MAHFAPAQRGITLIEVLVAFAVLAIAMTSVVSTFGRWIVELELRNSAHAIADAMALARAEAIKHGGRATLCKSLDRRTCTTRGGWEAGWLLFLDDNRNGSVDRDEIVVRVEPVAPVGISARGNQPVANYVSFTALGHARLISGALQMGTFTVCRPGLRAYQVVLANTGRVRVERATDLCP